ncbi:MAG TPA: response regulator [Dehalococcoidia bacterium]|nr:response regulator [Dehalococcoidia bacterium]
MIEDHKGKSILIIEDDEDIRRFAFRVLDLEGYTVLQAENGEKGLQLAKGTRGLSMVLLDLRLPDRDGWLILEELKKDPALSGVPVVVFSVLATPWQQNKAFGMGASGYLAKPVNASGLLRSIESVIHWNRVTGLDSSEVTTTAS